MSLVFPSSFVAIGEGKRGDNLSHPHNRHIMTPHILPVGRNIGHWRSRYSESEKMNKEKQEWETPIFAYFRRSTKKAEQALSLENQADDIDLIIKENRFDKDKVMFFSESRSAYEWIKIKNGEVIRKRTEFTRMLHEMDSSKQPCIILVKDSSRLSRNKKDNEEITKRLFGEYGNRKVIKRIIFGNGTSWDIHSDIKAVDNELLRNYHSSVDTSEKGMTTAKWQLSRGIYSRKLPQWLSYWKSGNIIRWLKQNEMMPIVRKAFEMKQLGATHKKISKYLREHGIKTWERDLNDRYFSNLIFIGEYVLTDKRTGEMIHYKDLIFEEGQPPISMALWQGAQENKGKKKDSYGDKQSNFALGEVLRTEDGRRLSGYTKKGTKQYKNTMEKIHVSDKWIIEEYLDFLRESIVKEVFSRRLRQVLWPKKYGKKFIEYLEMMIDTFSLSKKKTNIYFAEPKDMEEGKTKFQVNEDITLAGIEEIVGRMYNHIESTQWVKDGLDHDIIFDAESIRTLENRNKFYSDYYTFLYWTEVNLIHIVHDFLDAVYLLYRDSTQSIRENQAERVKALEEEKNKITADIKRAKQAYLRSGAMEWLEDELKTILEADNQKIKLIEEQIENLMNQHDVDVFFKRLPWLLNKTFELSEKVLNGKENEGLKEDIYDLIKLTTVELKIKKKKALEIELFWPVRQVLFWDEGYMEVLRGSDVRTFVENSEKIFIARERRLSEWNTWFDKLPYNQTVHSTDSSFAVKEQE